MRFVAKIILEAKTTGKGGDAFLGTKGNLWNIQSNMLFATIRVIVTLLVSKARDKLLIKM